MSRGRRALVTPLTALCLAQFVLQLDFSIVNVALKTIQTELGFSEGDLQWVVTSYALTFGALLLLGGRLGDRVGRRRLMLIGLWIFGGASLAGGLAPSPGLLVAARFVQGAGAALVAPMIVAMLTAIYADGTERTRALGIWTAATAAGASTGIVAGGFLTQFLGWRAVFLVNLPVIALLLPLARLVLPVLPGSPDVRLEARGALAAAVAIAALILGLSNGEQRGFGSDLTLLSFAVAIAAAAAFSVFERGAEAPILPLSFLRPPARRTATVVMIAVGGIVTAYAYFAALYLQRVLGYDGGTTALAMVPATLTVAAVSIKITRHLINRFGSSPVLLAGLLTIATGQLWLSRLPADGSYADAVLPGLILSSIGLALTLPAVSVEMTRGVMPAEQGLAGGVLSTAQQLGAAVGLAILATAAAAVTRHSGSLAAGYRGSYLATTGIAIASALLVAAALLRRPGPLGTRRRADL